MEYQTRHLVAKVPMRHSGRELTAGDHFEATDVDAKYYLQHNYAEPHQPAAKVSKPPEAPAPVIAQPTFEVAAPAEPEFAAEETQPAALSTTDVAPPQRGPYTRGRRGPASRS